MKNIIVLLIVFLILPCLVMADGPTNFGNYWKSMSVHERTYYLNGYKEGVLYGIFEMAVIYHQEEDKKKSDQERQLIKKVYLDADSIDMMVLSNVITDLYNDPANTYVKLNDMVYIARDKLQGQSIEDKLLRARREAQDSYQFMKNLMKDKK